MIWRSNKSRQRLRQKLAIAIAQNGQPLIEIFEAHDHMSCSLKILQMLVGIKGVTERSFLS